MYFAKVYFQKKYFLKVYFLKVYFPKVYFLKVYFPKVYFPKVYSPKVYFPNFFKLSVPGDLRVFRAFVSLLFLLREGNLNCRLEVENCGYSEYDILPTSWG